MDCDICRKNRLWLYFVGKDNVCSNCIASKTVFKEIKTTDDATLRKALRVFDIKCFDDLKKITDAQVDDMEFLPEKSRQTVKYKKVNAKVKVDGEDSMDYLTEMDQGW